MGNIGSDGSEDYTAILDELEPKSWHEIVSGFDDASLYQTDAYAQARWPLSQLKHFILKRNGSPISAAQVRVIQIPLLGGVAYLPWGPLWRRCGVEEDVEIFRRAIRAMHSEFVERLGLTLQLAPHATEERTDLRSVLEAEGFEHVASNYSTMLIDLSGSEESIRANLVARWRTDLNRSQRGDLELTEGEDLDLYDHFGPIYEEMFERKGLVEFGDLETFRKTQENLPESMKMKLMLCARPGESYGAGAITSAIGDTGLAVLWATNELGRDARGAYFLQWEVIRWLKAQGCQWYDLGGLDKEANPGGYRFKCGLGGKQGQEVRFLGQFRASPTAVHGFLLDALLALRERIRSLRQTIKDKLVR